MARDADLVVLSSGDALRDFKAFCPDHAHKGRVLHFVSYMPPSIYSETDSMIGTVREKYGLPERYFFLPNQFWKHKNHMVVLRALSLLRDDGVDDIHVICTGKLADYRDPGYTEQLEEFIKEKSLSDSFSILGLVGYKEMLCMMRHSLALLQPSLFEGWSSSVEEAKSLGKNCILSDLAVHREQAPAQSVYFKDSLRGKQGTRSRAELRARGDRPAKHGCPDGRIRKHIQEVRAGSGPASLSRTLSRKFT